MAKHTVVSMPGDGIGNQVLPEALRILKAVEFDAEYVHADIGWDCWCREGNALPQRTVDLLAKYKLGLFGAIISKPKKQAESELGPELRGKGYSYFSPIVKKEVERICGGKPRRSQRSDKPVAVVKWVDGTVLDTVWQAF